MTDYRSRGTTLMELIVVLGIVSLLIGAVLAISLQAAKVYQRTSPRIEPQQSQMLALKRMEREIREAMVIELQSTANALEIIEPFKENEMNKVNGTELQTGAHICFFLGNKQVANPDQPSQWTAVPSSTGNAIFRIENADESNFPLAASYSQNAVRLIIEGIVVPDPLNPNPGVTTPLFDYAPVAPDGTLLEDTGRVNITLTIPFEETTPVGRQTAYHELSTEFCIRNLEVAQPPE